MSKEQLDGAQALIKTLDDLGIEYVFGYSGGAALPIFDALETVKTNMKFVLVRHEQGAVHMADGYARATGKPACVLVTSGPGAGNTVTGLMTAQMDSVPMIVLCGQQVTWMLGKDAFQEADIFGITMPCVKHNFLVKNTNDLPKVAREAYHIATTGRPGPVLVDLPKNIQVAQLVPDYTAAMNLPGYRPEVRRAHPEQIAQVAAAIKRAKRPVIYAGGGVISAGASEELRELARRTGIPVTMTLMGLGAYPADDTLSLDMLGMHGSVYANYAVDEADLLLALGVRFDDRVTGKVSAFAEHGFIVHIDVDPSELNKNKVVHIPIVADVKEALGQLNKIVEAPTADLGPWHDRIAEWKREDPFAFDTTYPGILAQEAIAELSRLTAKRDTIITVGVGQHQMWAAQFYQFRRPRTWISSSGLGTMGFGLPAAMGAKVAHPDALVVDIDGDGSILMNIQELATCTCENIPVKVLLLNNQHLGMVVQWEDRFFKGNRAHTYLGPINNPEAAGKGDGISPQSRYPDFVMIARGFGWQAETVSEKQDLEGALLRLIDAPGPAILDVQVPYQEQVLPMIPSGMTVRDLIKR